MCVGYEYFRSCCAMVEDKIQELVNEFLLKENGYL